jgi:hypothetical protein
MKHGIKNKETWYTHIHMHQVIKNKLATRIYLQQFTDIGSQQEGEKKQLRLPTNQRLRKKIDSEY